MFSRTNWYCYGIKQYFHGFSSEFIEFVDALWSLPSTQEARIVLSYLNLPSGIGLCT